MADGTFDVPSHQPVDDHVHACLLALTTGIVCAYVAHNSVDGAALPDLIHKAYSSLARAGTPSTSPAVPINQSVFPNYIICLENGRRLRTLRRHLMSAYGLTPDAYRRRWGLPHDYPMVAPGYAKVRSSVARSTGLGRTSRPHPRQRTARSLADTTRQTAKEHHLTEL